MLPLMISVHEEALSPNKCITIRASDPPTGAAARVRDSHPTAGTHACPASNSAGQARGGCSYPPLTGLPSVSGGMILSLLLLEFCIPCFGCSRRRSALLLSLVCKPGHDAAAALSAGLLGIGGGMIVNPLLLEFNIHPQAAAATSTLMVLFSASSAALSFGFGHQLNLHFALIFGLCCMGASLIGVLLVQRIVQRSGKVRPTSCMPTPPIPCFPALLCGLCCMSLCTLGGLLMVQRLVKRTGKTRLLPCRLMEGCHLNFYPQGLPDFGSFENICLCCRHPSLCSFWRWLLPQGSSSLRALAVDTPS